MSINMKNVKSKFNENQLFVLSKLGIFLTDDKEYSDDELMEFHDKITDEYLSKAFDELGEPNSLAKVFEQIIDIFYDEFEI